MSDEIKSEMSEEPKRSEEQAPQVENDDQSVQDDESTETSVQMEGHAEQHYPIGGPPLNKEIETLDLPPHLVSKVLEAMETFPNQDLGDSEQARKWAETLVQSLQSATENDMLSPSKMSRESMHFTQKPEHNGKPLLAGYPRHVSSSSENLTGDKAVLRVMNKLGMGGLFQVPLWHSGIWVTIKPPTEIELVNLNRQLIQDQINFGRLTYGLVFSNLTVYTAQRAIDFALEHVYNTTIKKDSLTLSELKSLIKVEDYPILLWGIACSIYTNGFKYRRSCIADVEKCQHVIEETLNVQKLLWVDDKALTPWQKEHMSHRKPHSREIEQIKRYQEDMVSLMERRYKLDLTQDIYVTFQSPSVDEYIRIGQKWVDDIVNSVEETVEADATTEERESMFANYAKVSRIRYCEHWIKSIEVDDVVIEDRDTLRKVLDTLSSDNEIFNAISEKTMEYMNNSVMALIGIPVFECPKCHKLNEDPQYPRMTEIIPLDPLKYFFDLSTQRLIRLIGR